MISQKTQKIAQTYFLRLCVSIIVGLALFVDLNATASYNISTVIGTGNAGFSGDGGPGTSAMVAFPSGVCVNASGDCYFVDVANQRVRKITAGTNIISTIAGIGNSAYNGDNRSAISAALNFNGMFGPEGFIFVDSSGNVYIADSGNHRIRKITVSTGLISTIAGTGTAGFSGDGGAATSAMLQSPYGICLNSLGDVYFSDSANHRIRKITMSSSLSTLASGLNNPYGVCTDSAGNIYFTDTNNHCIKKIDATNGAVSVIAGISGTPGYNGDSSATSTRLNSPSGISYNGNLNSLMFSDTGNNCIRYFQLNSPSISTVAGSPTQAPGYTGDNGNAISARLRAPKGIYWDSFTNQVFIADTGNHCIRMFPLGGPIFTIAGNGTAGASGDGGPATAAGLAAPEGVYFNFPTNTVYVADTWNNKIRQFTLGGNISNTAGTGGSVYNGDNIPAISAALSAPVGVYFNNSSNTMYVADLGNNRIRQFTVGGIISSPVTGLNWPSGVFLDSAGKMYIADTQSSTIKKFGGGTISTIAGTGAPGFSGDGGLATAAQIVGPTGIYTDSSNNIYFVDTGNQRIRKITVSTGIISTIVGTGAPTYNGDNISAISAALNFNGPRGQIGFLFIDNANNIYIADTANNRIRKITASTGIISTIAGTGNPGFSGDGGTATSAMLQGPYGVCVDGAGSIYLADTANNRIRKILALIIQNYTITSGQSQQLSGTLDKAYVQGGGIAVLPPSNAINAVEVNNGILQVSSSASVTFNASGSNTAIVEVTSNADVGTLAFTSDGTIQVDKGKTAILSQLPTGSHTMKIAPGAGSSGSSILQATTDLSASSVPINVTSGVILHVANNTAKLPAGGTTVDNGGILQLGDYSSGTAINPISGAIPGSAASISGTVVVPQGVNVSNGTFSATPTLHNNAVIQLGAGATFAQDVAVTS